MKSLRTRRSTPSTAAQSRPPKQKLSKGNKDARKSRVDDKMKRRMSARYADISDPRDAEVPDMPDLRDLRRIAQGGAPANTFYDEDEDDVGVGVPGVGEEARVDVLDVRDLEQEEFDPDAYLRTKLASSTEAELRAFQSSLQTTKDATALDLQKNVFKNYSDFVVISKEISTLENDMLELKASLQEWKNMPTLLALDPSTSNTTGESANVTDTRRRTARSSIADLRTLYISQLQTLHSTIEGSATLVPTIPGRHIIAEASDLQQLNAATYRPEHGAHIVLLDDSLLVARRRRGRLVADRSWQLGEISLVDVRDTSELQNVFKIKRGQDTFVYKTERLPDKRALLSQFRKAAEELATRKRKEREGEHEKRRSLWVAGDRKSLALDAMPALPAWMAEMAAGSDGAAAKAEQDERWINNFIDELTVAVALRDWDSAVNLVVKGQGRTAMVPGLSSKLTPLAEQLTAELLGALSDPTQRRSSTTKVVAYIVRLGPDALVRARDTFLNARALLMRKRVRAIRFEGDVRAYIKELALIVFTSVKHTADWYLASFKDFEMASGLIRWAKEQVEDFARMFCIQVYGSETNEYDPSQALGDATIAQECIQIAKNQNRRVSTGLELYTMWPTRFGQLLRDIGMDFSFILLDSISIPAPSETKTLTVSIPEISLPDTPTENATSRPPRPPRSPAPPPPRSRDREREGSTGKR
ncbi:Cullin repeat-like-containing domain protein [Rhizoctonia solani]|nr:Cullin repeat-like-containing domain protein [Rhizoctonia solani]